MGNCRTFADKVGVVMVMVVVDVVYARTVSVRAFAEYGSKGGRVACRVACVLHVMLHVNQGCCVLRYPKYVWTPV